LTHGAFDRALEADEEADHRVIAGVGVVGSRGGEALVETVFHVLHLDRGNVDAGATKPVGADEDEERGVGRPAGGEILKPRVNDIASRQRVVGDHAGF